MYFQISLLQETTVLVVKMDARQILLQKQNFSCIFGWENEKLAEVLQWRTTYVLDLRKWRPRCDVLETNFSSTKIQIQRKSVRKRKIGAMKVIFFSIFVKNYLGSVRYTEPPVLQNHRTLPN